MWHDAAAGLAESRTRGPHTDARQTYTARPLGQNLCHALGHRLELPQSGLGIAGRQADRVGLVHDQQGARHTAALQLGDDVCVRALGQLCGVRRPRQHLLHIQSEDPRGQCAREPRAARPHRLPIMLPLHWRQSDCHQLWRHDLVRNTPP